MNPIPFFPALQQGATPQAATDLVPAENSETGFDELLKQIIPASPQTSLPVGTFNKPQNIMDGGEDQLSPNSLFESAGQVNTPGESKTIYPQVTGDAAHQNRADSTPASEFEFNTTDHHFLSNTVQTNHIPVSISAQFSDGNERISTHTLLHEKDFQFSLFRSSVHRFEPGLADTESSPDSNFHMFTYRRAIESGKILNPFQTKHSTVTGLPGSIEVTPSLISPAAVVNINETPGNPSSLKPGEVALQQPSPFSSTASAPTGSHSETNLDFRLLDARVPADHRLLSISIHGGVSQAAPGQNRTIEGSTLMVAELQDLISRNNDKVDMAISFQSRRTPSAGMHYMNSTPLQLETGPSTISGGLLTAAGTGAAIPVSDPLSWSKTEVPATALKQNVNDQPVNHNSLFDKAGEQKSDNQSSQQNATQHNNTMQSQTTMVQTGTSLSSDPATETPFGSQFQESTAAISSPVSKTAATQPSMQQHYVQEHEILNQIVNRFTIQSRLQSSRISLRLTPAELGELKINIVVKGDSLKANIYAQTRQAQEIIDKNIHRLKEVLQNSGISVDDLVVTFKSDNIDDFNNQQGHLFQEQNHFFEKSTNQPTTVSFDHTIEESMLDRTQEPSGVNLTI